jgi:hypothetical protein
MPVKNISDGTPEGAPDDEMLRAALKTWGAPETPDSLDRRVIAEYREYFVRDGLPSRKRLVGWSIRVPAPVGAFALALMLGAGWVAGRSADALNPVDQVTTPSLPVPTVEIPVVQETTVIKRQVVTRVVYRDRDSSAAELRGRPTSSTEVTALRASVRSSNDRQVCLTRANLAGFEPPSEFKIRVIRGGEEDEK